MYGSQEAPLGAGLQVPSEPVRSQRSHVLSQASSQQTPSAQPPLAHISERVHGSPCCLTARHLPFWQKKPPAQAASVAQEVGHALVVPRQV